MNRRFIFLGLVLLILAAVFTYIGWSLELNGWRHLLLALPFLCLLGFILTTILWRGKARPALAEVSAELGFFSMAALSYLGTLALVRDLITLASGHRLENFWLYLLAAGCFLVGAAIAARGPYIKPLILRIKNLPEALEGLRIVQITDLHIGFWIGHGYVARTVAAANRFDPHLIALTGDVADGHVDKLREKASGLSQLKARHGVYFVPGNHEYYWRIADWVGLFKGLGFRHLENSHEKIEMNGASIAIAGIPDPAAEQVGEGAVIDLEKSAKGMENSQFKILLSHRPHFAPSAAALGFDLQLSGHTHGGQFFPWTLVIHLFQRYALGLFRIGGLILYVSPGTGSWGPLNRLGTLPEITHITCVRDHQ